MLADEQCRSIGSLTKRRIWDSACVTTVEGGAFLRTGVNRTSGKVCLIFECGGPNKPLRKLEDSRYGGVAVFAGRSRSGAGDGGAKTSGEGWLCLVDL